MPTLRIRWKAKSGENAVFYSGGCPGSPYLAAIEQARRLLYDAFEMSTRVAPSLKR